MHRVELKVGEEQMKRYGADYEFLMHRVELKAVGIFRFGLGAFWFLMHRVELKVLKTKQRRIKP